MSRDGLSAVGKVQNPQVLDFLRRVFVAAREGKGRVNTAARVLDVSPRILRKKFSASGLDSPKEFVKLARRLEDALAVQAAPAVSLREIAFQRGFGNADRAALRRAMKETFGIPSARIRKLLGPEPLLVRWLQKTYKIGP